MGKSFKGFSKALSLILAVAMVVTCVPTSAYAAELLSVDESEDILISNDALVEESSEESSSTSIDTQKEADLAAAPEENTAGEEEISPDKSEGDVTVVFENETGGDAAVEFNQATAGDDSLDPKYAIEDDDYSGQDDKYNTPGDPESGIAQYAIAPAASEADYSFYVSPGIGYSINEDAAIALSYFDFSNATSASAVGTEVTEDTEDYFTVGSTGNSAWDEAGVRKVTISKDILKLAIAKATIKDGETTSTNANAKKVFVTANAAVIKKVTLGLTLPTGYTSAFAPTDDMFKWEYSSDDKTIVMTNVIKKSGAAVDPDDLTYTIVQTGNDADLKEDAASNIDKPENEVDVVTSTPVTLNGTDVAAYNTANNTLYIAYELLQRAEAKGRRVFIAAEANPEAAKYGAVTVDAESEKYATFTVTGIANTKKVSEDVTITVVPKPVEKADASDTVVRTVEAVKVSADGGKTFDSLLNTSGNVWKLNGGTYTETKDIKFYAECSDSVLVKNVTVTGSTAAKGTDYTVVGQTSDTEPGSTDITGNDKTATSGKKYTFKVAPKTAATTIESVEYQFGKGAKTAATVAADGTCTVTTTEVTGPISIYVAADNNHTKATVKLGSDSYAATLKDAASGTVLDDNAQSLIAVGKAYNFTVVPAPTKFVTKVEYAVDGGTAKEIKNATSVADDGTLTYTIPAADLTAANAVVISVTTGDGYKLTAPENENVLVSFAAPGKSIYVDGSKVFEYSVALKSGVSGLTFKSIGNTSDDDAYGTTVGTKTLAVGTDDIAMEALTDQVVPRDKFQVAWDAQNGTDAGDTVGDTKVYKLTKYATKTGGGIADTAGYADGEQRLTLAGSESIDITATFTANSNIGLVSTVADEIAEGRIKSASDTTPKGLVVAADVSGSGSTVDAVKITANNFKDDSDAFIAFVETADKKLGDNGVTAMTGNTLVYEAELPFEVVPKFSGFRAVATSDNSYDEDEVIEGVTATTGTAHFHVLGTSGRTGLESLVTTSDSTISSIAWTTTPDVKGAGDPDFTVSGYTGNTINVTGIRDTLSSVSATPEITYADTDSTKVTAAAATVTVAEKATYVVYPTVSIDGGITTTYAPSLSTFTIAATGALNKLTVDYKIYKVAVATPTVTVNDEDTLAEAIEKGELVPVSLDSAPEFKIYDSDDPAKSTYSAGEANGNTFVITGKKSSGVSEHTIVDIDGKINKVAIPQVKYGIRVQNTIDPVTVELDMVDTVAKTDGKINSQTLKKDPAFAGSATKVAVETDMTTYKYTATYKFNNVPVGSSFTLPSKADIDNANWGKGRIPYGWEDESGYYYELGGTAIADGDAYTLLWDDEYKITAMYNGNSKDSDGKYDDWMTVPNTMYIKSTVPIVIETTQITGIYTENDTASTPAYYAGDPKTVVTTKDSGFTLSTTPATQTFLKASSLTNRILEGEYKTNGTTLTVSAKWTDPNGAEKTATTGTITILDQKVLTLETSSLDATTEKFELTTGKAAKDLTVTLKNDGSAEDITGYTIKAKAGSSIIEVGDYVAGGTGVVNFPVKAVSNGTTTITVTAVDKQGNEAEALTVPVNVTAGQVKLVATKTVGTTKTVISDVELSLESGSDIGGYNFNGLVSDKIDVQAFAASDSSSSTPLELGTWTVTGDGNVAASTLVKENDGKGGIFVTVALAGSPEFGTGKITLNYTPNGDTSGTPYVLEVPVKSYKPVVFMAGEPTFAVTKGGKYVETLDPDGKHAAYVSDFVKVFLDKKDDPDDEEYEVSVSDYAAEYVDGTAKTFAGWKVYGASKADDFATSVIDLSADSDELTGSTLAGKGLQSNKNMTSAVLEPQFTDVPIKSIEFTDLESTTITLDDSIITAGTGETATTNVELKVRVNDASSLDTIDVYPSKIGFFKLASGASAAYAGYSTTGAATTTSGKIAIEASAVAENNTRTDKINLGMVKGQAGSTVLTFKSHASGAVLGTITLNVNGATWNGGGTTVTGYVENGANVKSDFRTVDKKTVYFDDKGAAVTKSGVYYVSSIDKKVLVKFVSVTNQIPFGKGVQTVDGKNYYVKSDETGEIACAELIEISGVQRYANSEGVLVTYEMTTDGKYTDPETKIVYVIDKDTNAAKLDKKNVNAKFTWKTKKPSKFEKSSPLPTNEFEITYNVEGDTEKKTVTGTVTAVADPSDYQTIVGLTKLTFTFTPSEADIAGFFSDDKGEKALTVDPEVWTFNFKNGGSTSSSGGIEIVGLEEEYKFTGTAIKPVITVEDNDLGITLAEGTDYKLSFKDNTKIGTATITVNGKGNYQGKTVTGQFKIVSPTDGITAELAGSVKKIAKISESFVYDGEAKYPATITVTTTDGDIVYQHSSGDTYTTENAKEVALSFANNVNAGSATVAATGKDGKTKKTTFKITKVDLSAAGDKLEIAADDAAWAVKGAVPEVTVTYTPEGGSAITLVNGKDYKVDVTYAAKKNVATGNTVKITGKGTNFTKSAVSGAFEIEKYALSDASIVSVGAYAGVAPKAIKAIVVDGNGVIIPAKQYTLKIEKDSEDISTSKTKLVAGDAITVTVTAAEGGNLDGSGSVDVTIAPDLNKAKVVLSDTLKKNGVEYTGASIDLESYGDDGKNFFEDGITVQLKNASKTLETLEYGTDFEVAGYQNNIKKGTMTVYIRGISEKCSGTKAFKVKISAKTMKKAE